MLHMLSTCSLKTVAKLFSQVGKSSLVSQCITSDYINTYDASLGAATPTHPLFLDYPSSPTADDEYGEKSVSVSLDGQEAEITFIDHPSNEMSVRWLNTCEYEYRYASVPAKCRFSFQECSDFGKIGVYQNLVRGEGACSVKKCTTFLGGKHPVDV